MAQSARFESMVTALNELRTQFLPAVFDPTGTYDDSVVAHARAYRVLAHAEVEHFLEDRAGKVVRHALAEWKHSQKPSRTLMALIAFSGRQMDSPPESLAPAEPSRAAKHQVRLELQERLDAASEAFFGVIEKNHGIKEKNLLKLLIPVALDHGSLDPVWMATMNSFGEARGKAAHLSAKGLAVSHRPDPKSEHDLVNNVVAGLKDLDSKLAALEV